MPKIINKTNTEIEEGQYYSNEDGDMYITATNPNGMIMLINLETGNHFMNSCATDWDYSDFVEAGFFRVYPQSITFA